MTTAELGERLHVWIGRPAAAEAWPVDVGLVLSPDERARHQRYLREADRRLFLAAHVMVRHVLSHHTDIEPAAWRFGVGDHGRPEIVNEDAPLGLRFNLSHTDGMIAVLVHGRLDAGVDVERVGRVDDPLALAGRVFAPAEHTALAGLPPAQRALRFTRVWTLKEAFIKATGMGLAMPLSDFWFDDPDADGPSVSCRDSIDREPDAWSFAVYRPSPEHVLSTACRVGRGRPAPEVAIREFDLGALTPAS